MLQDLCIKGAHSAGRRRRRPHPQSPNARIFFDFVVFLMIFRPVSLAHIHEHLASPVALGHCAYSRFQPHLSHATLAGDNPLTDSPNSALSASPKSFVDIPYRYIRESPPPHASSSSNTAAKAPSGSTGPRPTCPVSAEPGHAPGRPPLTPPATAGIRCGLPRVDLARHDRSHTLPEKPPTPLPRPGG